MEHWNQNSGTFQKMDLEILLFASLRGPDHIVKVKWGANSWTTSVHFDSIAKFDRLFVVFVFIVCKIQNLFLFRFRWRCFQKLKSCFQYGAAVPYHLSWKMSFPKKKKVTVKCCSYFKCQIAFKMGILVLQTLIKSQGHSSTNSGSLIWEEPP